jgi:drug/metabolite transporter (DMT)-like permease
MENTMTKKKWLRQPGVLAALTAALLFGAGTPFAKLLLNAVNPWMLAGLLYIGSGIGLTLYRRLTKAPAVKLPRHEALWFAGAIVAGGIVAPGLVNVWPNQDACIRGISTVEC